MPRRKTTGLTDQEVVNKMIADKSTQGSTPPAEETPPEPETREPNIADRFVSMNALIVNQRQTTRLNETTLAKTLELAVNYHIWQTMRDEQREPAFDPRTIMGPDNGEVIGPAPDNVVPLHQPGPASGTGEVIYRDDPRHPLFGQPIEPKTPEE